MNKTIKQLEPAEMSVPKLSEMNDQQKRIACAEECGCLEIADHGAGLFCKRPRPSDGELSIYPVPDYGNDDNAMRDAVNSLNQHRLAEYGERIQELSNCPLVGYVTGEYFSDLRKLARVSNLTASIKLDAFLIATGRAEL